MNESDKILADLLMAMDYAKVKPTNYKKDPLDRWADAVSKAKEHVKENCPKW